MLQLDRFLPNAENVIAEFQPGTYGIRHEDVSDLSNAARGARIRHEDNTTVLELRETN